MSPLSPEVQAVAERQAAEDRAILGRLRASGKVVRQTLRSDRGKQGFIDEIEALAFPSRTRGLDTIRPNPKNRKGKRR